MRVGVISILLIILQGLSITIFQFLRIGGIMPNWMIIVIVSFGLLRGSKEGAFIGFAAGLLQDITFGLSIGPMGILYAIIGFVCGKFNKNFYRENFILPFLCTICSEFVVNIVSLVVFLGLKETNIFFFVRSLFIPELIYTATLSLVLYQIMYIINEKIEIHERRTRNMFD